MSAHVYVTTKKKKGYRDPSILHLLIIILSSLMQAGLMSCFDYAQGVMVSLFFFIKIIVMLKIKMVDFNFKLIIRLSRLLPFYYMFEKT